MFVMHLVLQGVVGRLIEVSRVTEVAHCSDPNTARVQLGLQITHVRNVEQPSAWITRKNNDLKKSKNVSVRSRLDLGTRACMRPKKPFGNG